ncbi:MAG: serine/threonine-protein kinase [Polyangiales bacterium]
MHAQLEDLYSLKLPLGRNLAGAVWQAETLKGGKPAAVAVLDLENLSDADLRKRTATRFRRDMGLLQKVNHPHVVRVLNVGRTRAGRPFAAMEHVDGESLHDWLSGEHSGAERIRVASGLLDGLQAAHRAGVTHGDLEPGNVLMTPEGTPKLIGFGLNRTLARQSHPEWREESGLARTLAFRAPEEARGMGGHSADLYATGILLHLICSDELPDGGSTLRENAPKLPAGLVAVIERALVEEPQERHANIAAMRRAWMEAAKVARDGIESATTGFRTKAKPAAMRPLSAPPVGVALLPDEEEELDELSLDEMEMGRVSLMPVGIALADEDEDEDDEDEDGDLTSIPPEQVNMAPSRPAPEGRVISQRFSEPPADPGMRISLTDALAEELPVDPEMRLSVSDMMEEVTPTAMPSRPQPAPMVAAPEQAGGSKAWLLLGLVAALGTAGFFLMSRSPEPGPSAEPATAAVLDDPGEVIEEPEGELEPDEPEPAEEAESAEPVALRLHGLPSGASASVDGEPVAIEGDTISFPGDGAEHTITVRADGFETWERSLATATPLDLLVVSEAIAPPPETEVETPSMEQAAPAVARESREPRTVMSQMSAVETAVREAAVMEREGPRLSAPTMRPSLARDPGF